MLKIKLYRQKTSYTCGPACLKMIFEYYGVNLSEEEISQAAGTTKYGTPPQRLVNASKKLGFTSYSVLNSSFSEIKRLLGKKVPVIVNWFSTDAGHYSVVVGIDNKNIYLADPEVEKLRVMKLIDFYRVWFDFTGEFLKSNKDLRLREIVVVIPR